MRNFGSTIGIGAAFCAVLAVLGSSCSTLPGGAGTAAREARIVTETDREAQEQAALGKYRRALEIYSNAYDRHHLPELRQGYARLGERIRTASDAVYQKGNFFEAGSAYRILFESGITTRDFAGSLSFDDEYLSRRIEACSKALMEIGLIKYREEKLDEAIAVWKKALLFDAGNKNVKNALDIATVQLRQLKSIK